VGSAPNPKKPPKGGFFATGLKARMHALLRRLHSSFGGFGSSVSSGFGSIGSASGSSVSSGTSSSFDSTSDGGGSSSVGGSGSSVNGSSRSGFHRCWSSSRCWRLNRCFFFFTASGQGNSSQQGGDQEGLIHEKFQWMCTKRSKTLESTKKKPEPLFELNRFSLTPICECVSRLERNDTPEKTTVFTLIKYFFYSHICVAKMQLSAVLLQTQGGWRQ
jgi:hypothetical protein